MVMRMQELGKNLEDSAAPSLRSLGRQSPISEVASLDELSGLLVF